MHDDNMNIEALDLLIGQALGDPSRGARLASASGEAQIVAQLAHSFKSVEPSSMGMARARARLLTEADDIDVEVASGNAPGLWSHLFNTAPRWAMASAASIAIVVATLATVIDRSAQAIPGDPLYGVKRTVEEIAVQFNDSPQVEEQLALASKRVEEVRVALLVADHIAAAEAISDLGLILAETTDAVTALGVAGAPAHENLAEIAASAMTEIENVVAWLPESRQDDAASLVQSLGESYAAAVESAATVAGATREGSGTLALPSAGTADASVSAYLVDEGGGRWIDVGTAGDATGNALSIPVGIYTRLRLAGEHGDGETVEIARPFIVRSGQTVEIQTSGPGESIAPEDVPEQPVAAVVEPPPAAPTVERTEAQPGPQPPLEGEAVAAVVDRADEGDPRGPEARQDADAPDESKGNDDEDSSDPAEERERNKHDDRGEGNSRVVAAAGEPTPEGPADRGSARDDSDDRRASEPHNATVSNETPGSATAESDPEVPPQPSEEPLNEEDDHDGPGDHDSKKRKDASPERSKKSPKTAPPPEDDQTDPLVPEDEPLADDPDRAPRKEIEHDGNEGDAQPAAPEDAPLAEDSNRSDQRDVEDHNDGGRTEKAEESPEAGPRASGSEAHAGPEDERLNETPASEPAETPEAEGKRNGKARGNTAPERHEPSEVVRSNVESPLEANSEPEQDSSEGEEPERSGSRNEEPKPNDEEAVVPSEGRAADRQTYDTLKERRSSRPEAPEDKPEPGKDDERRVEQPHSEESRKEPDAQTTDENAASEATEDDDPKGRGAKRHEEDDEKSSEPTKSHQTEPDDDSSENDARGEEHDSHDSSDEDRGKKGKGGKGRS